MNAREHDKHADWRAVVVIILVMVLLMGVVFGWKLW